MIKIYNVQTAKQTILKRIPPDETDVPPSLLDRIAETFGERISAEEAVRGMDEGFRAAGLVPGRDFILQEASAQGDRRNAATWYRQVVEALGWDYEINSTYPDSERLLTIEEQDILDAYRKDPSGGPSPEVRRLLTKAGPMIEWLRRGSQQRYSDFQLDYSQGFGLLLHLPTLVQAQLGVAL